MLSEPSEVTPNVHVKVGSPKISQARHEVLISADLDENQTRDSHMETPWDRHDRRAFGEVLL